ncbi:hypothetical protein INR49_010285 [Caranx melampygus]|nr:hypothetical protein INR49_010285 [Caranx melampygus]
MWVKVRAFSRWTGAGGPVDRCRWTGAGGPGGPVPVDRLTRWFAVEAFEQQQVLIGAEEKDLTAKNIIKMEGNKTSITNLKLPDGVAGDSTRDRTKTFTYDFSYDSTDCKSSSFVSQEKVFRDLGSDVLKAAFEGYNACVFAYGQTGSGKSYTMMGNPGDAGLIPRICEGLFSRISDTTRWDEASFRTEVSYLEIYNERVRDLLRRKSTQTYNLRVREHPKDGPYVEDLSKHLVQNYSDVEELMEAGNINRTTASTGMNDVSSRSHAIFTINFTQAKFDAEMPSETVSKIHLVDLAGTDMTQDGVNTNLKKKSVFVPYRDSVLTWLLKDSLGGNAKTIMIATVSPADVNYGETLSTLRYANRAKNIINKPTINEDANVRLIRELRAEIARLKALLVQGNQIALLDSPTALSMEEKLHQNEARVSAGADQGVDQQVERDAEHPEGGDSGSEEGGHRRGPGLGAASLIGIDDDLLSTGIILYHLKEGRTYVGREDASTEQDIIQFVPTVLHGLDLESEHCMFQNQNGAVTLVPLGRAQCSVNGSGLLSTFSLSMSDLSKSCENLSTVMLYNPGLFTEKGPVFLRLEFERQQREELEKLELKRLIKEMEAKQQSEKAELERLQQEVESQRKESEEVQQRILRQEESLRRRSQDIESRLRDFLAEKERFEEERRSEIQGVELQRGRQQQEGEEEGDGQDEEQRLQQEAAEQTEIYRELERLKREREEQKVRLEAERRRLEEQEREQLSLVGRLEEQLREKHEAATTLLTREDARRLEEERRALAEIRGALLRAKEAGERPDVEDAGEEARSAQARYADFKVEQVKELGQLEEGLRLQRERLEKEVAAERSTDATAVTQEEQLVKQAEHRLQFKERQLANLADRLLPALAEEKQRAVEMLERSSGGSNGNCDSPPGLDNTLYQVEKELEDKEEKLNLHWHSAQQLQQLQETYEFTANVARQEEKVRRKEKEILESKEKQQREAMEQAVARLERRHSALRRSVSLEPDTEEQRHRSSAQRNQRGSDLEQQRVEREIQKLRQRISEGGDNSRTHSMSCEEKSSSPVSHIQSLNTLLPLSDDRINAYIEEEVQRRLRKMNLLNGGGSSMDLSLSCESLRSSHMSIRERKVIDEWVLDQWVEFCVVSTGPSEPGLFCAELICRSLTLQEEEEEVSDCSSVRLTDEDDENMRNVNPRRQKYESASRWWPSSISATAFEANSPTNVKQNTPEEAINIWLKLHREEDLVSSAEEVPYKDRTTEEEGPAVCELVDVEFVAKELVVKGGDVEELSSDQSSKSQNSVETYKQHFVQGQIKPETDAETVATSTRHVLGYFAGKLTEVYKDAGRRLQGTRDIIRNVGSGEMKVVLSQYVTMISKELPLIHHMQLKPQPEPCTRVVNKVSLVDLSRDHAQGPHQATCESVTSGVAGRPEGSVSSIKNTSPEMFHQRMVELPPALSRLQTFSSSEILQQLESLSPQVQPGKPQSIFWLKTANSRQPSPKPGCLLLSEKDITVITAGARSEESLVLFHHVDLLEIKTVQISLAGQHVRLIGRTRDAVLVVLTHSKELTQEFCRALVKALAPGRFSEGTEGHPLLSEDLTVLSLDWTSNVPDIILDSGLHVTSRFKRVLADLLYIVHGNMDGPDKPSLADVCPLLYTSVKVKNSTRLHQDAIFQFLLTDTHVVLLREDGVFHPVPRGSSLVPVQPQFQGLELRKRSDIRCLVVRQSDNCLVVEVVFTAQKPAQTQEKKKKKAESGISSSSTHLVSRPLGTSADGLQEPVRISIPRYVLRGQGKDEHFEFEVKITVMDDTWTVFRRYSRFREMHKSLKLKYPELAALEFPPKKLFGNRDERMVAERRTHLEAGHLIFESLRCRYLRNLFRVMLSSSSSPLRTDADGGSGLHLSKHTICEFSPFFKKGVFEYGSHGTG